MVEREGIPEGGLDVVGPPAEPIAPPNTGVQVPPSGPLAFDELMAVYGQYVESVRHYNTIIWQFPAAFITYNVLALYYFKPYPSMLLTLSVVNFAMLHSLFKHIHNQGILFGATRAFESYLESRIPSELVPKFGTSKGVISWRSAKLVARLLLVVNILYFLACAYSLQRP